MILLDTGFLIALELEQDEHYSEALRVYNDIINKRYGSIYVSDYVFDEAVTLTLSRTRRLSLAVRLGNGIKESYELLRISDSVIDKAWEIFKDQKEPELSFTDCTNIAIMNEQGIKNIATFDRGFESIREIKIIR